MEASLVVPGPLDVAGTFSRFHLWGEEPAGRCGVAPRLHGLRPTLLPGPFAMRVGPVRAEQVNLSDAVHHEGQGSMSSAVASGALDLDSLAGLPNVEVIE